MDIFICLSSSLDGLMKTNICRRRQQLRLARYPYASCSHPLHTFFLTVSQFAAWLQWDLGVCLADSDAFASMCLLVLR